MKTNYYLSGVLLMSFVLLGNFRLSAADAVVTQAMIGHWEGKAQIIVSWCQQKYLPIAIDIAADGSVNGKVGDATLAQGQLASNRGWLGRKLNLASDYIITGRLIGPVVAAENITRSGVNIPLSFTDGTFVGGLHTTGSKVGGKEKMILSARALTLKRTNLP